MNKIISILDENNNPVFLEILHVITLDEIPSYLVCNITDRNGNVISQDPVLYHADKAPDGSNVDWEISPVEDESIIDAIEDFLNNNLPEEGD